MNRQRVVYASGALVSLFIWWLVKDPLTAGVGGFVTYVIGLAIETWAVDLLRGKKSHASSDAPAMTRADSNSIRAAKTAAAVVAPARLPAVQRPMESRPYRRRFQRRTLLLAATSLGVGGVASWLVVSHKRDDSIKVLTGHSDVLFSVIFSPDGRTVASGCMDKTIRIWDVESGSIRSTLALGEPGGGLADLNFSPDGRTIMASVGWTAGLGERAAFWDLSAGNRLGAIQLQGQHNKCAFSSDGTLLAVAGAQKTIALWDIKTRKQVGTFVGHSGNVADVAFSKNARFLASISSDNTVRLWDVASRQQVAAINDTEIGNTAAYITISPNETMVGYTMSPGGFKLWRVSSATASDIDSGVHPSASSPVFSPDSRRIACVEQSEGKCVVRIFDVETRTEVAMLYGHDNAITSLAYSPDGKTLASCSFDKTVRIWSAA